MGCYFNVAALDVTIALSPSRGMQTDGQTDRQTTSSKVGWLDEFITVSFRKEARGEKGEGA